MDQNELIKSKTFNSQRVGFIIFLAVSAIVVFHHFFFLSEVVTNIPNWDDYDLVLRFLNNYADANSFTEKVNLISQPHNEHRVVETRMLSLLQWKLSGQVNFKTLTLIGNCQLILLLALFAFYYRSKAHSWYALLPLPFMLFNLNSYSNMVWTTTSVTNLAVLLFAMIAIVILNYKPFAFSGFKFRFWVSFAWCFIAMISGGVGFLAFIVCACSLWVNRAPKKLTITWTLIMIGILALHFASQQTQTQASALQQSSTDILVVISRFIILIGNYFILYNSAGPYIVWSMGGIMMLGIALYLFTERPWITNPMLFCCLIFLVGSAGIIALGRASEGETQAFTSRYVIYSTLIAALLYSLLVEFIRHEKTKYVVAIVLATNLYLFSQAYVENAPIVKSAKDRMEAGARSFLDQAGTSLSYPNQNVALALLEGSEARGLYTMSGSNRTSYQVEIGSDTIKTLPTGGIQFNLEEVFEDKEFNVIKGWAFVRNTTTSPATMQIVLVSEGRTYLKTTTVLARQDVQDYFKSGPKNSGFRTTIFNDNLIEGTYAIAFLLEDAGNKYLEYAGRSLTIRK